MAEQLELEAPMGEFVRGANVERYKRLLAEAADEMMRATIERLLKAEQEVIEKKLDEIKEWRMRAQELRTLARQPSIRSFRRILLEVAASYESLADHADARALGRRSPSNDVV